MYQSVIPLFRTLAAFLRALFFYILSLPCCAETIFLRFIITVQRGNNIFVVLSSPCSAGTISLPFYRRRAARKQYFHVLSSPCSAETISLPFYRRRAARKQYFRVLSSPCSAGTIFVPFYRRRAAREQYFRVSVLAASLRALKFLFSPLQNGGTCWNGRGGACVPARTSAQRRFHPKMRCCHPQTLRFHLRKACFHVQTRCFYPRKAPPNDGCALAGRAGGHTGTAPTTLIEPPANAETILVIKPNGRTCADAIRADVNTLAEGF